jgi:hypothetical protein
MRDREDRGSRRSECGGWLLPARGRLGNDGAGTAASGRDISIVAARARCTALVPDFLRNVFQSGDQAAGTPVGGIFPVLIEDGTADGNCERRGSQSIDGNRAGRNGLAEIVAARGASIPPWRRWRVIPRAAACWASELNPVSSALVTCCSQIPKLSVMTSPRSSCPRCNWPTGPLRRSCRWRKRLRTARSPQKRLSPDHVTSRTACFLASAEVAGDRGHPTRRWAVSDSSREQYENHDVANIEVGSPHDSNSLSPSIDTSVIDRINAIK